MNKSLLFAWPLELLLTAESWDEKRRILEENQELLLTREAIDFLEALGKQRQVWSHDHDEWIAQTAALMAYRGLLQEARVMGIREAWAIFMTSMTLFQL